jgi:hypothetical protein
LCPNSGWSALAHLAHKLSAHNRAAHKVRAAGIDSLPDDRCRNRALETLLTALQRHGTAPLMAREMLMLRATRAGLGA